MKILLLSEVRHTFLFSAFILLKIYEQCTCTVLLVFCAVFLASSTVSKGPCQRPFLLPKGF
jgi:hypothetical protein